MSANTSIEWADRTWNPLLGCERVSPGCDACYAINTATIRAGNPHPKIAAAFAGLTARNDVGKLDWTGRINLLPDRLNQPHGWRKPQKIFVNSQADLFHDDVPDDFIGQVFAVMAATPRHTYQILTKRHGRMRSLMRQPNFREDVSHLVGGVWPLPNVWLGVSVEDQKWADIRVPALLDTPAVVRWLSCEPLLGPLNLRTGRYAMPPDGEVFGTSLDGINWVVVGGESGPTARPMHPDWARFLRDQCAAAGVPFFFKQHGQWEPLGPLYDLDEDSDTDESDVAHMDAVAAEIDGHRVIELETSGYIPQGHQPGDPRTWLMASVGKKRAGRELDGRTYDEYPQAVTRP